MDAAAAVAPPVGIGRFVKVVGVVVAVGVDLMEPPCFDVPGGLEFGEQQDDSPGGVGSAVGVRLEVIWGAQRAPVSFCSGRPPGHGPVVRCAG